ncbi:SDR family oxidoreductase [Paenibacillus macquariensis]|uniref:NADP-dependent 3-hydroxy acid dehydrogenase YdfG n=1 Tax=Paenibacillus macquariensis TaxID=948756 RepID=A0ABY1JT71_9BACL|nr:SDR family oxidoreductase [Paenibacillus macquariensis]MEC0093054.1 SDR family oxidoreductase [Paenibacillus macquariensis]OAB36404.1 short-chain dehydrogenase/reductase [Paenibacillus macquariensis subsp. macquariensis]SIQ71678.1 NADP-dependent 3-hydroxy acid dehydrogenase YdfG [Paenibacillus macquariensis]
MIRNNKGKIALITGCSSGFGLLTSVELAREGFMVVSGMRNPEDKEALMKAAQMAGVESSIQVVEMDVRNEVQVQDVVMQIQNNYGRLDILINNAGVAVGGMIEEIPLSMWKEQMEINFLGMVCVTQAVLPLMREGGRGLIIQMSSISGNVGFPGYGPYASSKFALEGFSECLAMEVKPFGIDVVLVEPGAYGTPIWGKSFSQMSQASHSPYKGLLGRVLQYSQRSAAASGNPLDVAKLIAKIATVRSPAFRYALPRGTTVTMLAKQWLPDRWFHRIILNLLHRKG